MKTQFAIKAAQVLNPANLSAAKRESTSVLKFLAGIKCCENNTLYITAKPVFSL